MAITPNKQPSRLKLFWALSRTPHGLLDMATPALGALLWLGEFPPPGVICIGLITVFAGYTAVYALNDVIDYSTDKEKVRLEGAEIAGDYLDAALVRHPMAQGLLSFRAGLFWVISWGIVALIGAFILNPVCVVIFLFGCILEAAYCLLLKVSYLRVLFSGVVKACGSIAAVFAVDPDPSALFVLVLFLWLFFWEIGGQNIPNDWTDTGVDRALNAQTVPVRFGSEYAGKAILGSLSATLVLGAVVFRVSPILFGWPYVAGLLILGVGVILYPGMRLYKTRHHRDAMALFNKASYYPLGVLVLVVIRVVSG